MNSTQETFFRGDWLKPAGTSRPAEGIVECLRALCEETRTEGGDSPEDSMAAFASAGTAGRCAALAN